MGDDSVAPAARMLLVTGTVGSGKTATAREIGEELRRRHIPNAVIDLDELRRSWPAPPDDLFNERIGLLNLEAVVSNYRRAGASHLIAAGVVEKASDVAALRAAVGVPVVIARLAVDLFRVGDRLLARHEPGDARDWHLRRSGELDEILDRNLAIDVTIAVGAQSIDEVARHVLDAAQWA